MQLSGHETKPKRTETLGRTGHRAVVQTDPDPALVALVRRLGDPIANASQMRYT